MHTHTHTYIYIYRWVYTLNGAAGNFGSSLGPKTRPAAGRAKARLRGAMAEVFEARRGAGEEPKVLPSLEGLGFRA